MLIRKKLIESDIELKTGLFNAIKLFITGLNLGLYTLRVNFAATSKKK